MGHTGSRQKPSPGLADHPAWWLVLLALLAGQGWLTLGLFGADHAWAPVLDDRPVLSGRHPLHLYHGLLGARALLTRGCLSCYDPSFLAGYPKTPVFDPSSRPAEIALALCGGDYRPAAYKVFLVLVCVAAPWLVWTGARGAGLNRATAALGALLALAVWWGRPCGDALEAGDLDVLLAGSLAVAHGGQLLRYHRDPGPRGLFGAALTGFLAWLAFPLIPALLLPPFFVYYLSVGTKHPLTWHVALLASLATAIAANAFWLIDWVEYCWIRLPPCTDGPLLAHRTLRTLWEAPLWGAPADRAVACLIAAAAALGLVRANQTGARASARLFGMASFGFLALAIGGICTDALGRLGTTRLLIPGLLLAAVPAAAGLVACLGFVHRWAGVGGVGVALASAGVLAGVLAPGQAAVWEGRLHGTACLRLGLDADRQAICAALESGTTPDARILWEDRVGSRQGSRWTALLPLLTGRCFVGALDPDAGIEHATAGLRDQMLAGRPLDAWSDAQLTEYCARYNVGWIVCWTAATRQRFEQWAKATDGARATSTLTDGEKGLLLHLRRRPSFALAGSATWLGAETGRVVLGDVTPRDGKVVLSLHYQAGLSAAPGRIAVEPELDPNDPIPFVRLRLDEPVARVTLTWDKH